MSNPEKPPSELPPVPPIPDGFKPATDPPSRGRMQPARPDGPPKLTISVAHGNLSFASHPIAIGHYDGDLIVSAEAALDEHLDRLLTARHASGTYPGPLLTSAVVFNRDPERRPRGGIIVGLGRAGQLSPGALRSTLARAVAEYASALRERRDARNHSQPPGLSCLLIGTGEGGLSLREALQSMVEAILEARLAVEKAEAEAGVSGAREERPLCLARIEFVELWEDMANEAIDTLCELFPAESDPRLEIQLPLRQLPGGLRRIVRRPEQRWWRRLQITQVESGPEARERYGNLAFLALTDRARVPRYVVPRQLGLVDPLVRDSISRTAWDPELSRALFELLIPEELKASMGEARSVELVLDATAAAFPWEMLIDPRSKSGTPFSVEHGLVRRLIMDNPPRAAEEAEEGAALVIGNPKLNDPSFPDLPAATREAVAVAQILSDEAGFRVVSCIDNYQKAVVRAAFGHRDGAHGYRILHLAGHGVHSEEGPSGMLLGPGVVLGANEIRCMPAVPELVFINCCHLGRIDGVLGTLRTPDPHRLAANLGVAFIERGARAVIAAGWAVNDLAARTFAEVLYRELLGRGAYFGDAVRTAREAVFARFGDRANTWGAYQCYGDHSFRLRVPREPKEARKQAMPSWVSPRRVVQDLHNLIQQADTAGTGANDLRARVESIDRALQGPREDGRDYHRGWYDTDASVRAHLALAYANLGAFRPAVEHWTTVRGFEPVDFPVRHLEILANLRVRAAFDRWRTALERPETSPEAEAAVRETEAGEISRAIDEIDRLRELGETAERWSLLGSAYKRLAAMAEGWETRRKQLRKMDEYYERARDAAAKTGLAGVYPHYNFAFGSYLLDLLGMIPAARRPELGAIIDRAEEIAEEEERGSPSLLSRVSLAELQLLRQLAEGHLPDADEVCAAHVNAWRRGGSVRAILSIAENLYCAQRILQPMGGARETARRSEVAALLAVIEGKLRELMKEQGIGLEAGPKSGAES